MSQEINLLSAGTSRLASVPSAWQAAAAVVLVLVLGIATSTWLDTRVADTQGDIELATSAIDDLIFSMEERSRFLAERNADPVLVAELERLEREAGDKKRVLELLSGGTLGNTAGFSEHLAALGRRHPNGLWLQQIRIAEGGRQMLLRGSTLEAALIPRFLDELEHEPAFAGTAFQSFEMDNAADGAEAIRFVLATACGGAPDDESAMALCTEVAALEARAEDAP